MDCCNLGAITAPADSREGLCCETFFAFSSQDFCIFSTQAATAAENPVVVKTSRSIHSGETAFLRYKVKPPSCFPFLFVRLMVRLQFVSENAGKDFQKY